MKLTVNEIYSLAEFVGIPLGQLRPDEDYGDAEIVIEECPEKGILDEDAQVNRQYRMIAWDDEYPEEGIIGLGPEIPHAAPAARRGKGRPRKSVR